MNSQWIPLDKIQQLIQYENLIVLLGFYLLILIFYKLFLKKISEKRHNNLKQRFKVTLNYLIISTLVIVLHWLIFNKPM